MELTNEFRVGVSVPEAWKVLTDVERIAPMMPGAQLQEVEGDEYRGVVKVKVGPITAQYKGKATFVERDEAAGRVVLRATGRDSAGPGQRQRPHHRHHDPRRRRHQGVGGDRPDHQRQGGPVRAGRARRGERQAARPVRRRPGGRPGQAGATGPRRPSAGWRTPVGRRTRRRHRAGERQRGGACRRGPPDRAAPRRSRSTCSPWPAARPSSGWRRWRWSVVVMLIVLGRRRARHRSQPASR